MMPMHKKFVHVHQRSRQSGLTLIEVMIAVSILAVMTTLVWGSFQDTFHTKTVIEANGARYHTVRVAIERITRELEMAFLSQNDDTTQAERRTFFVGKRNTEVDELRFSMLGHQRLYSDANEADTSQVLYYGVRDRDDPRVTNLMRRETRRLSNLKLEDASGEADMLCDNVVRMQVDYWDGRDKAWRDTWSTRSADGQPDRLPSKVKVTLVVVDERGQEVPFQSEVRLPMQEPLDSSRVRSR